MKSLSAFLFLLISNYSFGQGLIFSTVTEKPSVLMLEKRFPWSGEGYMAHVDESSQAEVPVVFIGEKLLKLNAHLLKSESVRIFCDGDFSIQNDFNGNQFIALSTVSVCIDEEGWVVAHSFGKELQTDEIQRTAADLSKSIKKKDIGGGIYQGSATKDIKDNSSSSKQQLTGASHQ